MARKLGVSLLVLLIAGCQPKTGVVGEIPQPNFNGPNIAVAAAPQKIATPIAPVSVPRGRPSLPGLAYEAAWVPKAPARPWKWIVIHHSATPSGSAAVFDREHREKGWDELGYHFVIGNGTQSGDGQVEVGSRWPKQKWGAHAKTPDNRYNDFGIGICLVGNFQIEHPTQAQLRSLSRLVAYLMKTYRISPSDVIRHKDTKQTECPGNNLDVDLVRRMAMQTLADAGDKIEDPFEAQPASSQDLLGAFDISSPAADAGDSK